MGRPTKYSKAMAERIVILMSMGYSLNKICSYQDMPSFPTVQRWLHDDDKKDFRDKYTRAREYRTDKLEDEILDIADNVGSQIPLIVKDKAILDEEGKPVIVTVIDNAAIQHARLRVDTRHRHLEAMKPKLYGKHAGLGDEIKTGLLAKMEIAAGRLEAYNKGRTFDNDTGKPVSDN